MLSASRSVLDGLNNMAQDLLGDNEYVYPSAYVELPVALFLVEVAKRAPDTMAYFPHGKWATIQAIQGRIEKELDKLKKEAL